jgi:hypothetical protein
VAPSTTVERRLIVEAVPTPIPGPQVVSSTTLPLSQPIAPADVQRYVQQQSQNVRDLSLPIYVSNQLPSPEPNSPLVIQTTNTQLNIVTINDQVIQLQDGDGFRLSVSATDGGGDILPVNTNGAIVVEQNNFISVSGTGFRPNSTAVVWLFSVPNRLGTVNVGADGSFSDRVALNDGIEPGEHTAQVNGITSGGALRSLNLAVEVIEPVTAVDLADAAVLGKGDSSRAPGPRATIAQYSPQNDPETTRNLAVAATALMSLAAAGVARNRREERRGKLASVVTKKLKAVQVGDEGAGDLSATWRGLGTEQLDRSFVEAPLRVGKFSALLSRVLVDGAWLRAIFGSRATLQWTAAVALTIGWLIDTSAFVVVPATWLLCALVAMTALDALSGLIASSLIVTAALVFDRIYVAADVRALLGVAVLLISTPLLAHVIRPLRRDPESVNYARERFYDYAMMPVFVAFAAGSMAKALNGLAGLDLVSPGAVTAVKWTVWLTMILRLAGEDVALRLYPVRSLAVQPSKLVSQARSWGLISVAARFAIYLFVAYPFFGLNVNTVFAAALVLGPALLKLWEDDLPNNEKLFFWLPRGFLRFFLLLIAGAWMGAILVADDASADVVRTVTPWLLVPAAIFGIVELFGRAGKSWRDDSVKHAGGAALWTLAVLVVSGQIQLF